MHYHSIYFILLMGGLLLVGCSSTLTPSSIQFDEVYHGQKETDFAYGHWIINIPETTDISPASKIQLTEVLMDRGARIIGSKTMFAKAAQQKGLVPMDVPEDSPKMMASLCDESFKYLLHVKVNGNKGAGGGVAYGGFERENYARVELTVFTIPGAAEVFHYSVTASEVSGTNDEFEESNGGEIVFGKSNEKIQRSALKHALNALKRKSNLPIETPE